MSYEFTKRKRAGKKKVRGRYKNACADQPGTICYGFVFEPDPNGNEWGYVDEDEAHPMDELDVYAIVAPRSLK